MTAKDTLSRTFVAHQIAGPVRSPAYPLPLQLYKIRPKRYIFINPPLVLFLAPQGPGSIVGQSPSRAPPLLVGAVYVGGPYYKALHYTNSSQISVRRDRYPIRPFLSSSFIRALVAVVVVVVT